MGLERQKGSVFSMVFNTPIKTNCGHGKGLTFSLMIFKCVARKVHSYNRHAGETQQQNMFRVPVPRWTLLAEGGRGLSARRATIAALFLS